MIIPDLAAPIPGAARSVTYHFRLLLGRITKRWHGWSLRRRLIVVALAVVITVAVAVAGYLVLRRPADVSNPEVSFVAEPEPAPEQEPRKPKDLTVDWPTYGFDDARNRHFPTDRVRPPFASSDWSFQAGKLLEFSPIVVDDVLYFMDIDTNFYALDARTGKQKWKTKVGSLNASAPAYKDGRLFAVSLEPGQAVSLRARDGKVLWKQALPGRSESSPLIHRGLMIFGCECGSVYALDVDTGEIKWELPTGGAIKGALALDGDGVAYGGNYAGEVFAVDAFTGKQRWRIDTIGGSFGRGGGVYSTPTVAYGRVYLGSIDSRVYSLDKETGDIAWSYSTGAEVYSGPAVADTETTPPSVYIGSIDGYFYALDARTGELQWKQPGGGEISGAASVIGDVVYASVIGEAAGTLGFDLKTGEKVYENELGEYNPAITDGRRLFLTGYSNVRAYESIEALREAKQRRAKRLRAHREARRAAQSAARETTTTNAD